MTIRRRSTCAIWPGTSIGKLAVKKAHLACATTLTVLFLYMFQRRHRAHDERIGQPVPGGHDRQAGATDPGGTADGHDADSAQRFRLGFELSWRLFTFGAAQRCLHTI